jgi:aminopeptidase-like protein
MFMPSNHDAAETVGQEMYNLIYRLYPLCRSITGNGVRETLRIIQEKLPLEIHEVPTGTQVFDWQVPKEWNIRDAYVKNPRGEKVIDFQESNLHVVNYSIPVHKKVSLAKLKEHLYTIPDHPDWIPYQKSYFKETWGFCLTHNTLLGLEGDTGEYEVVIDSTLEAGHLTYGEYYLPGRTEQEILLSTHCCHPSLCNDNLSGLALTTYLAKSLQNRDLRYSYRFLYIPSTIGSIVWLASNQEKIANIKQGLVIAGVGDPGPLTYKLTRNGNAEIDRAVKKVLYDFGEPYKIIPFSPFGYDERQYSSPGINLLMGLLSRTMHGQYVQYHTSADNLEYVQPEYLADSLKRFTAVIHLLENNITYKNTAPYGEPQLGKRGLTGAFGGGADTHARALLWILNLADGQHSLLDISERSDLPFAAVQKAAKALCEVGLLQQFLEPRASILTQIVGLDAYSFGIALNGIFKERFKGNYESCPVLRWTWYSSQRIFDHNSETHGRNRISADYVAFNEILCSFRPQ